MAKKTYVLTAYDYDDDSKRIIAVMDLNDKRLSRKEKAKALRKFLTEHYEVYINECTEDEAAQFRDEIKYAAKRLCSKNSSADVCGDCLSWNEVTEVAPSPENLLNN